MKEKTIFLTPDLTSEELKQFSERLKEVYKTESPFIATNIEPKIFILRGDRLFELVNKEIDVTKKYKKQLEKLEVKS